MAQTLPHMGMKGGWLMVQRMGLSILLMGGMKITTHVIVAKDRKRIMREALGRICPTIRP